MLQFRLLINPSIKLLKSKMVINGLKMHFSGTTKMSNKQLKSVLLRRYHKQTGQTGVTPEPIKPDLNETTQKSYSLRFLLLSLFTVGLTTGLLMGYMANVNDQYYAGRSRRIMILSHPNPVPINHGEPKEIEHPTSVYTQFPLNITLYQYETSPFSAQIRAYLDYFGFTYDLIEVDPFSKSEVKSFEKNPHVPICVLQDRNTDRHWFLYDSPTILSALETLRCENYSDYYRMIPKYLPIVVHLDELQQDLRYPNRYIVSDKSDMNDSDARKWINTTAIPVFNWNSADTKRHAAETVNLYAERCHWKDRFNAFKRWYMKQNYKSALYKNHDVFKSEIQHLNPHKYSEPMDAVHDVVARWENVINEDRSKPFHGHDTPDLADLSMFGAISAFDGCELFDEALNNHKKFNNWYSHMEEYINNSYGGTEHVTSHRVDWLKIKDDVMKKASRVKDRVEDSFNTVYGKASEVVDKTREKAGEVVEKTREKMDEGKSAIERGTQNVLDTLESSVEKATTKTDRSGSLRQRILETSNSLFTPTDEQPEEPYLDPELDLDVKSREAFGLLAGKTADMAKTGKYKAQKKVEEIKEDVEKGKHKVDDAVTHVKDRVVDSARQAVRGINDRIVDEAHHVVDMTKEGVHTVTSKTKEKMSKFADIVQEEARSFVGAVEEKSEEISKDADLVLNKAKHAKDQVINEAERLVDKTKATASDIAHKVSHLTESDKGRGKHYNYIDSDENEDARSGMRRKDLRPFNVLLVSYLSLLTAFSYAAAAHVTSLSK